MIAGYPGQEGGRAIARTLFGANNPSGKLTQTWYRKEFINGCSMFDMAMRPGSATTGGGCIGRTYRFYTGTPVFKFGSGLSFTSFDSQASSVTLAANDGTITVGAVNALVEAADHRPHTTATIASVTITVTNTGKVAGTQVLLGFVVPPSAGSAATGAPLRSLARYERVPLQAGDSRDVTLHFSARDLAFADRATGAFRSEAGEWKIEVEGTVSVLQIIS